ncbi:hypothetical protein GCM10007887_22860 [Methylobacterium haplocladii]|uniref:Uncharacterized protein n=1 Tax=Methylobacterium haplocladii TaxID=1176176 RepID=A0A512IUR0_9HYPH|nr:hypothetical protein MHA02_38270 [Methylobacterium haplocladii]GLS59617.1 hypothetical protein GCM10007887_22860 [Methylobacterium haplocladii]
MRATTIGFIAAGMLAGLAAAPAQAECVRSIVNKSALTALVRRDGGPWVTVPPHRSQAIRFSEPGSVEFALVCGRPGYGASDAGAVYRGSVSYTAIIDRCYYEIGTGFFEDQLGPGFFPGTKDTAPLTVNVPRQGDVVIGPRIDARCPAMLQDGLRARY